MKFLVIGKRNQLPMDPKMGVSVFQAAGKWEKAQLNAGNVDLRYNYVDGSGGFGVVNGASHEEVYDRLLEAPYFVVFDWEVIPLVDWDHSYKTLIKMLKKMAP